MVEPSPLVNKELLRKYFPDVREFRDIQEAAVNRVASGRPLLCLMPTGAGKSLIYQIAGMRTEKTTLVFSPLIALMNQQASRLEKCGIPSVALHSGAYGGTQFYEKVRLLFCDQVPRFMFLSPERAFFNGYLEHVFRKYRDRMGLVVVDEAHCISQWGHSFRPSYKTIPSFLRNVFGSTERIPLMCLTATLNPKDQDEICRDFSLEGDCIMRSPFLLRKNLNLGFEILRDERAKVERLEELLKRHRGEKTIVYAHRIRSDYGTRALTEQFKAKGVVCEFFDSEAGEDHKRRVMEDFEEGRLPVVFATNAFGMGVDIPDIRVVIHYLVPESIEQYYQEVGRAGRDGTPSAGYLLFSETNLRVRRDMIRASFPSKNVIQTTFMRKLRPKEDSPVNSINPNLDFSDESKDSLVFHALVDHGVIKVLTKAISSLKCFAPITSQGAQLLENYLQVSKIGSIKLIAKRKGVSVQEIADRVYCQYDEGAIRLQSTPASTLFYRVERDLTESVLNEIGSAIEERKSSRLGNFERFVQMISSGAKPESLIREHLGVAR